MYKQNEMKIKYNYIDYLFFMYLDTLGTCCPRH